MAATVWITDAVTVTALGRNLRDLWQALLSGHSAIAPVDRFSTAAYMSRYAACIEDLNWAGTLSAFHDLLTRLLEDLQPVPADTRLYTATAKAGIDNLERMRRGQPADASDILVNAVAERVSGQLGLTDTGTNISAACASSAIAVAKGASLIVGERAECVLVCCIDLVTEFVFSGFSALGALSENPCMPFDRDRSGLTLGEGAAALVLMNAARAQSEGRRQLATVLGWGVANDAFHVTAPDPEGQGLACAVKEALKQAGIAAEDISAISAHGTGTVYNDHMELKAFDRLFRDRKVPIYSIKGAIGHTLGAAGGIEVAVGLKALSQGVVPPTAGFRKGDGCALGRVSPESTAFRGSRLLSTNSGFGGINAALILGYEET